MPRRVNQKTKLLFLYKIFEDCTDSRHGLTTQEILEKLAGYGIHATEKTFYADLKELQGFDADIQSRHDGKHVNYRMVNRRFTIAELKVLIDAVESSGYISPGQSHELITKLTNMAGTADRLKLNRQMHITGRVKARNDAIFSIIDTIHAAIAEDRSISFRYMQWNMRKQLVPRHDGKVYAVSPWALVMQNERYYLVAYDNEEKILKHFRVDKIADAEKLIIPREGSEVYSRIDLTKYVQEFFGMYGKEEYRVKLRCASYLAGSIIDQFGTDIAIVPEQDEQHFIVTITIRLSDTFLGWVFALGPDVEILSPEPVVEMMRDRVRRLQKTYLKQEIYTAETSEQIT